MVSDKSRELIGRFFNVGSLLGVFPAVWSHEINQLVLVPGKRIHFPWNSLKFFDTRRIFSIICLSCQVFYFLYFLLFLIFGEKSNIDICLSLYFIVTFNMAGLTQLIGVVLNFNRFCDLLNVLLLLELDFSEFTN